MRRIQASLLAGVSAIAFGLSGAALAQSNTHVTTVQLPYGGTAQIRYTGDVPPRVSFSEAPATVAPTVSMFGPGSPFAALDRISTEMDRQMTTMFRQADMLAAEARSGQLSEAALRSLPPGTQSYSFVSTISGNGVCTESVEITSQGNGHKPRVVRHSSGDCGPQAGAGGSVSLPAATPPEARPGMVWTSAAGAKPYAGLVREIPAASR